MSSVSICPYSISLKIKSFDLKQLYKICIYVKKMSLICGAQNTVRMAFLPEKKKHISLCRSPHIHKKSRTQLLYKRHKVILYFKVSNCRALQETLYFFKSSYLPGIEYVYSVSEKAYIL